MFEISTYVLVDFIKNCSGMVNLTVKLKFKQSYSACCFSLIYENWHKQCIAFGSPRLIAPVLILSLPEMDQVLTVSLGRNEADCSAVRLIFLIATRDHESYLL